MKLNHDAFFDTIASPILYEDNSPYRLMMDKLNYIGYYYIVGEPPENHLNNQLTADLKKRVLADFRVYADQLTNRADEIEHKIMDNVYHIFNNYLDEDAARNDLKATFTKMYRFVRNQLLFISIPKFTRRDINSLYRKAELATTNEQSIPSSDTDVLNYYHAIVDHAVWTCRQLTRRSAGQFMLHIIELLSKEFAITLPWSTNAGETSDKKTTSLPVELEPLVEIMAESVHDIWMKTRLEQGWTYGNERNDILKTHPCLVPYDELPESEKVYDRKTSTEALEFIINHGYRIVKDN